MSGFTLSYDLFGKLVTSEERILRVFAPDVFTPKELNTLGRSVVNISSIGTMSLLFYRLLKIEFERCAREKSPFILVNLSLTQKAVDHFFHHTCSRYVVECLGPSLLPILDTPDEELKFVEFDPLKFPLDLGLDEIEKHIEDSVDRMNEYMHGIGGSIFSQASSRKLPITVKSVVRFVQEFAKAFQMKEVSQIGSFLLGRLFCRAIQRPENWGITPSDRSKISPHKRRILRMISQVFDHLALGTRFDESDPSLEPLNHNINELETFANIFLTAVGASKEALLRMHSTHARVLDENIFRGAVTSTRSLTSSTAYIHQQLLDKKERILDEAMRGLPDDRKMLLSVLSCLGDVHQCVPEEEIEDDDDDVEIDKAEEEEEGETEEEEEPPAADHHQPTTKAERRFAEYMKKAQSMNFSDFEHSRAIQVVGTDCENRPIVLCKEPLMFDREQNEKFLYYILWKLDEITKRDYTVVVCLNRTEEVRRAKRPGMGWFRNAYQILPRRYKKNMKHFYMVHPNLLVSILMKVLGPLLSRKTFRKVHMCNDLRMIYAGGDHPIVTPEQCRLPSAVIAFNIEKYHRGKGLQPKNPVYGVPLSELMKRPHNIGELIPRFHRQMISFITEQQSTVGIFRKAGNTLVINAVKDAMNFGYAIDLSLSDFHSVCGAWKLWFRDLPTPVIPHSLYRDFLAAAPPRAELRAASGKKCFRLFQRLKRENLECYHLCVALFRFLHGASKESETSLMTPGNLAIVFGPNVLRTESKNPLAVLKDNPRITAVTESVIMYAPKIFPQGIEALKKAQRQTEEPKLENADASTSSSTTTPTGVVERESEGEAPPPPKAAVATPVNPEEVMLQRRSLSGAARRKQRRQSHRSSNIGKMELTMLQFALQQQGDGEGS